MDHKEKECRIAVIGAGTMGMGIAQCFVGYGFKTSLFNRSEKALNRACSLENLSCTMSLKEAVGDADIIFECVSEEPQIKKAIFKEIFTYAKDSAIVCSSTSALNIYEIVEEDQSRVLIAHFFNPPQVMPLVEIVRGENTSQETIETVKELLTQVGKKPILINRCVPGFIFNRLLTALEREAFYIVEEGMATCEDVDTVIKSTFGVRFAFEGIFDLLDHVGLDVEATVVGDLLPELCNSTEVPKLLLAKVAEGSYGVKTGQGLKDYSGQDIEELRRQRTVNIIKTLKHIESL